MRWKRRGELRDASEGLLISLDVEIEKTADTLVALKRERGELKKKVDEEE